MKNIKSFKHLLSMHQFDRQSILSLFSQAKNMAQSTVSDVANRLIYKKLALLFFQTSTRTRLNFETAMLNLGGNIIGFSDIKTTRSGDFFNESLSDVVQVVGQMVDCIVIRHYSSTDLQSAAALSPVPIINGGDGSNEHPTQALIDLWVMHQHLGSLDNIRIGIVGDPSTRVLRSLLIGLSYFKISEILFLLSPDLTLSQEVKSLLKEAGISWNLYENIQDLLQYADAIEILPIHLPDLTNANIHDKKNQHVTPERFRITRNKINKINRNVFILHPGPRLDELDPDTDDLPQALYVKQVKYAIYLRMALLNEFMAIYDSK